MDKILSNPLLTWFLSSVLTATGFFWLWHSGIVHLVLSADITGICAGLLVLFTLISAYMGWWAYRLQSDSDISYPALTREMEIGCFVSDMMPIIGLIGTVIGLSYMFQSTGVGVAISDTNGVSALLAHLGLGTGTALFTTL